MSALVNDALALLAALDVEAITAAGGKPAEAVALLALVAGQDVEPADGSDGTDGRWRIARELAPDRVISTVDPEARHAHKTRERRQDGFKAHVVVEPDTGLTTAAELTKVNGPENSDATDRRCPAGRRHHPARTRPVKVHLRHVSRSGTGRARPGRRHRDQGRGARRFRLRHRRDAGQSGEGRAEGHDQAVADPAGGDRRIHHRRLRLRRRGRHADLPQRGDPHG